MTPNVLEFLKRVAAHHWGCEDGWYACPMSEDYIKHGDNDDLKCQCWAEEAQKLLEDSLEQ